MNTTLKHKQLQVLTFEKVYAKLLTVH